MALLVPNLEASPTFDAQAIPDATDLAAQLAGAAATATGVVSGCGVTPQGSPNMTVQVAAGTVVVTGTQVAVSAVTSLTIAAADATDRKDIVVVNNAGTVSVVKGTDCGTAGWTRSTSNPLTTNPPPVKPAIPANSVLLGEVYVAASTTSIAAGNIIDKTTPSSAFVQVTAGPMTLSGTPAAGQVPVATGANAASWQNLTLNSATAIGLTLTETVLYPPTGPLKGNTSILNAQNETFGFLPKTIATTGAISQGGSVWTVTFASSILGTLGQVGDTFQCWLDGWTPSAYNIGSFLAPVTATIASSTTITIPNATTGSGNITVWGTVTAIPKQYSTFTTPVGLPEPRGIIELEGTNTFNRGVDSLYGLGPLFQATMVFTNGTVYSATTAATNGSNVYKITGDQRANLVQGLKMISATSGIPANAYVGSINYDGTNTNITAFVAITGANATFTGSTGNITVTYPPDIVLAEGAVMANFCYANGGTFSYPLNNPTFGAPGMGQGWGLDFWAGSTDYCAPGSTLSNINRVNYTAYSFLGPGATGIQRIGYLAGDVLSAAASVTNNYGLMAGQLQPDALTLLPYAGGTNNYGIVNASAKAAPAGVPFCSVTSGPAPPSVTGIASTSTTFTVTFASAHGLSAGNDFTLAGFTPSAYNGTWTVTSAVGTTGTGGTYTVTVTTTLNPGSSSVQGTATYLTGLLLANAGTPTLTVSTTAGFYATNPSYLFVTNAQGLNPVVISYTGMTGTTFTGCTIVSGSTNNITPYSPPPLGTAQPLQTTASPAGALGWSCTSTGVAWRSFALPVTSFTLPVPNAETVYLDCPAGSTGGTANTGYLAAGAYDGQEVTYINLNASNTITFNRSTTNGQRVSLFASRAITVGGYLKLRWIVDQVLGSAHNRWSEIGFLSGATD